MGSKYVMRIDGLQYVIQISDCISFFMDVCSLRLYDLSAASHSQNSDIVNMIKPVLIVCQRDPSARNSGASVVGEDEGALEKP